MFGIQDVKSCVFFCVSIMFSQNDLHHAQMRCIGLEVISDRKRVCYITSRICVCNLVIFVSDDKS